MEIKPRLIEKVSRHCDLQRPHAANIRCNENWTSNSWRSKTLRSLVQFTVTSRHWLIAAKVDCSIPFSCIVEIEKNIRRRQWRRSLFWVSQYYSQSTNLFLNDHFDHAYELECSQSLWSNFGDREETVAGEYRKTEAAFRLWTQDTKEEWMIDDKGDWGWRR